MKYFCNFVCRDLSNNLLAGPVPDNGSFSLFTPIRFCADAFCKTVMLLGCWYKSVNANWWLTICSFANNLNLCGPVIGKPCPGSPPFSPPPPFVPPSTVSSPGDPFTYNHSSFCFCWSLCIFRAHAIYFTTLASQIWSSLLRWGRGILFFTCVGTIILIISRSYFWGELIMFLNNLTL